MSEQRSLTRATIGALGVVYGDIGTSPLYALKGATDAAGGATDAATVLGVLSLISWSLFLVITLKYIVLILRSDNAGEGGVLSLLALVQQKLGTTSVWAGRFVGDRGARHRAVLLRRADHARDLGAFGRRRPRDLESRARQRGGARHRRDHHGAVHVPAPRHRARRRNVRADHGGLVRDARCARRAVDRARAARARGAVPGLRDRAARASSAASRSRSSAPCSSR